MTPEEPKTMTGLEALAYLNEKREERFVKLNYITRFYRISTTDAFQYREFVGGRWVDDGCPVGWILSRTEFIPCPDPSKPDVSEYESAKQAFLSLEKFRDPKHAELCASVIDFFEEWYVRKPEM